MFTLNRLKYGFGCLLFSFFLSNGLAQNVDVLSGHSIEIADSTFKYRDFKKSADLYYHLYKISMDNFTDDELFNAAKACAIIRHKKEAYEFLSAIIKRRAISKFRQSFSDPAFSKLRQDNLWAVLLQMADQQQVKFNSPVAMELTLLEKERMNMDEEMKIKSSKWGTLSTCVKNYKDTLKQKDSINSLKVKSIINVYGWLDKNEIGQTGVNALVFLYMLMPFNDQKLYYPLISEAFQKKKVDRGDFAAITDKISLYDTKYQIFGTQVTYKGVLYPIENRDSVNFRRILIGLDPLILR